MKNSGGSARRGSVSSMSRLAAQKLAALETVVADDALLKNVTVRLDESSSRMLDSLARSMRSSRSALAQELLMASISDLAQMVSSRVKVVELNAAD
jgi:hypothetical protein